MQERLWSIEDVALWLNVSSSTVRRWVRSGKLAGQKAGAQWRFDPSVVREAFERGILSARGRRLSSHGSVAQHGQPPEWAASVLSLWRRFLENVIDQVRPDHVVVNDRKGAKIWKLLIPNHRYIWGTNLWHSTAVQLMTPVELRRTLGHRRVLLFDEMMQYGRELHELRQHLEVKAVDAVVSSVVCIRRRSYVESGELLEYEALCCEDLDDSEFAERAALISRLAYLFEPPLDVDHLVVKGTFIPGLKTEDFLERAAKWGIPFIVWYPDKEHQSMAITLDRPQFFDASTSVLPSAFSCGWDGPVKVRFYGNPENVACFCSFIAHPDLEAPVSEWAKLTAATPRSKQGLVTMNDLDLLRGKADETVVRRAYSLLCMQLAVNLLDDFVRSGAAEEVGIRFDNSYDAIDVGQLRATFGPTNGSEVVKRVRAVLARASRGKGLFPQVPHSPMPPLIQRDTEAQNGSHDVFRCRAELLNTIPQRYSSGDSGGQQQRPISWGELLRRLAKYSASTIGRVFDYELDLGGTAKPLVWCDVLSQDGNQVVKVWRGFCRGEFGVWFEWDRSVFCFRAVVIQRTLGLGPVVVDKFLQRTGETQMTATQFNKSFANIQHDLRERVHDQFYLGWRPYKYGPVPVVPVVSASGEFEEFSRFLVEQKCLHETRERHGSRVWRRYHPDYESYLPWQTFYRLKTSAVTRAHVSGLVRLYAAIQKQCTTTRPSDPRSSGMSVLQDALVVLGSARNQKIAYICGWFEVCDWIAKGELLLALLGGLAAAAVHSTEPFLKEHARGFAAPARLLFDKIQMYRNLPHLRRQVVDLAGRGDLEAGEVLLDSVDLVPEVESHSQWPIGNLEWASNVMRAFSSMTRQVLTTCGLDVDERPERDRVDENGAPKDATFYVGELLLAFPQLVVFKNDLLGCIDEAATGILTETTAKCLGKVFRLITTVFDEEQRIPDPRPQFERDRERLQAWDGLITRLRGIPMPEPYAIVGADIRNLRNLPRIAEEAFGGSYDDALLNLLNWVERAARDVDRRYRGVCLGGLSGDLVIFTGPDPDEVVLATVDLIRQTTRRLATMDRNLFAPFGLLRAGIAWREDALGGEQQGVRPGIAAHDLANKSGGELGAIRITKRVWDRLSPECQDEFDQTDEDSGQGRVFVRYWNNDRDLGQLTE